MPLSLVLAAPSAGGGVTSLTSSCHVSTARIVSLFEQSVSTLIHLLTSVLYWGRVPLLSFLCVFMSVCLSVTLSLSVLPPSFLSDVGGARLGRGGDVLGLFIAEPLGS